MNLALAFDLLLVTAVVMVGYRAIHAPALFTGVVLYIAFGLLLSLIWVRLGAMDVAIAEAAIGAGVTGALLLDTAGRLGVQSSVRYRLTSPARRGAAVAVAILTIVLWDAIASIRHRSPSLVRPIAENLSASAADHPVTAMLLDFRGYDTLLEVSVLLVATIAVVALRRGRRPAIRDEESPDRVTTAAASILLPFTVVVAGYLVWRGAAAPGGAFQAGAVLGAAAILYTISSTGRVRSIPSQLLWPLLSAGVGVFLLAGLVGVLLGDAFLDHPEPIASGIVLVIEVAVSVSVATTLVLLYHSADATGTSNGESSV